MIIWRNGIKGILKASLPTIIVPAVFVSLVFKFLGLTVDSLLAVIFFGQFYIIWGQLEVAMRQTRLSTLEYDPEFIIDTKKITYSLVGGGYHTVKLRNIGKHLAQNVLIFVDIAAKSSQKQVHSQQVSNIAPNEIVELPQFNESDFNTAKITINLHYNNILGYSCGMTFIKEPKYLDFIVLKPERKMPGILLNSFEDLTSFLQLFAVQRELKRMQKERILKWQKIKK
jgi:hypothetical protein